jgi:two-component system LytT family response regulator
MSLRVLIADDEALAREGVELLLQDMPDIEVLRHCENGRQAVNAINELRPDLVLLDINMPGLDGFEVVRTVGVELMPLTIFLTAYDEFAVEAFRINALDYLLKPINAEHFKECLDKARKQLVNKKISAQSRQLSDLLESLGQVQEDASRSNRIMVRTAGHVYFIRSGDIFWVEADGDYVILHTKDKSHLVRATMKTMEDKLSAEGFQRIHRSSLVNLDSIQELIANDNGDYRVLLNNDQELKLSRNYRDILYARLNVS